MKVNMTDHTSTLRSAENVKSVKSIDERLNETEGKNKMSPAMKMYYQDFMQKIMLSDGSDPDNQPDW